MGMKTEDTAGAPANAPFERVYRGILRALYEGRFVPGQRLVAPDLMREFSVGRGTIREVLQRLASTGVVAVMPHKGAAVRRLSRTEVVGILEVVEVLIGLAARGAAKAVKNAEIKKGFQSRFEAMRQIEAKLDFNRFLAAREDFYRFLVAASDNPELQRVFPNIQVHIMRIQLRSFDHAADSVYLSDYSDLNQAIFSEDVERAEKGGREHVRKTLHRVVVLPDRAFESEA
jgi:DNA-binding GntR family transcriptional regulator